jgi:hypothetical protein
MLRFQLVLFSALCLSSLSMAQVKIKFIDYEKKEPIESIFLLNQKGETVAISNAKGECVLAEKSTVKLNHLSYPSLVFTPFQDTIIYLNNTFQEVDQVTIKGMTNEQLFEEIIKKSKAKVKKDGIKLEGKYFEMSYYIEEKTHDTVRTVFSADIEIVLPKKKKSKYNYYLSNVQKMMSDLSKIHHKYDTIQYYRGMKIIGDIQRTFENYDLRTDFRANMKKYNGSKRFADKTALIEFYRDKRDMANVFKVYYDPIDSIIISNIDVYSSKEEQKSMVDFLYFSSAKNYATSPFYFLNFIAIENDLSIHVNDKTDRIFGVKALLINKMVEIDEQYITDKKEVKDIGEYSFKFKPNASNIPILFNHTRF